MVRIRHTGGDGMKQAQVKDAINTLLETNDVVYMSDIASFMSTNPDNIRPGVYSLVEKGTFKQIDLPRKTGGRPERIAITDINYTHDQASIPTDSADLIVRHLEGDVNGIYSRDAHKVFVDGGYTDSATATTSKLRQIVSEGKLVAHTRPEPARGPGKPASRYYTLPGVTPDDISAGEATYNRKTSADLLVTHLENGANGIYSDEAGKILANNGIRTAAPIVLAGATRQGKLCKHHIPQNVTGKAPCKWYYTIPGVCPAPVSMASIPTSTDVFDKYLEAGVNGMYNDDASKLMLDNGFSGTAAATNAALEAAVDKGKLLKHDLPSKETRQGATFRWYYTLPGVFPVPPLYEWCLEDAKIQFTRTDRGYTAVELAPLLGPCSVYYTQLIINKLLAEDFIELSDSLYKRTES